MRNYRPFFCSSAQFLPYRSQPMLQNSKELSKILPGKPTYFRQWRNRRTSAEYTARAYTPYSICIIITRAVQRCSHL